MSAKQAAESLMQNDPHLLEEIQKIEAMDTGSENRRAAVMELLRQTMGTWTLTLAAHAANVDEESVIAAIAYHPSLRVGTYSIARGIAARLYHSDQ
jgi:hypothetical protein